MPDRLPPKEGTDAIDTTRRRVTGEVSSEGGSPGDVEVGVDQDPATGSEATETARPVAPRVSERVFDETGDGKRDR